MRILLLIAVLASIAFFAFKDKLFPKKTTEENNKPDNQKGNQNPQQNNKGFPLQKGSTGDYVKQLQKALNIKADGVWGNDTQKALETAKMPLIYKTPQEIEAAINAKTATDAAIKITKGFAKAPSITKGFTEAPNIIPR